MTLCKQEAGLKCSLRSDYSTASSYLTKALKLLPKDSWKTHYKLTLQLSYHSAKTAYCLGSGDVAREAIRAILREGHCIEDKVNGNVDCIMLTGCVWVGLVEILLTVIIPCLFI